MTEQTILDREIDLCFDEEANRWYFQKFLKQPKYSTRESREYHTREEALKAYHTNTIQWANK